MPLMFDGFPAMPFHAIPGSTNFSAEEQRLGTADAQLQAAKDAAIPDRSRQGGIISVGQCVELCGCHFKVHAINGKKVILKGIPK